MRLNRIFLFLAALVVATPVFAQVVPSYSYPSAGTPPFVPLQCSSTFTNCLPITSSNPLPVVTAAAGPQPSASSQSVTPATDADLASKANQTNGTQLARSMGYGASNFPAFNSAEGAQAQAWYTRFGATVLAVPSVLATDTGFNTAGFMTDPGQNLRPLGVQDYYYNRAANSATPVLGDMIGAYVVSKGSATLATGQISVGTTATLIRAVDTGRTSITVIVGAANTCAFGNSGVTLTTGYALPATAGVTDTTTTSAALYGVCSAATTVSYKVILP